ncbi:MAG TPA: methionine biosynthesis protein MetW [Candidatus Bathyarchaeia archaeon]
MTQSNKIENEIIFEWIKNGSTVLDLGCGDGDLLARLMEEKNVRAQGIELSEEAIHKCVARGLSVFQEDLDSGLAAYGDDSFDYVILNQTFQQVKKPDLVLREALRVGRQVVVGFPNFCYLKDRIQIFFRGKVPVTASLPYEWYDTPNLHFLSIVDFKEYCNKRGFRIEKSAFIKANRRVRFFPNLLAEIGLFQLNT